MVNTDTTTIATTEQGKINLKNRIQSNSTHWLTATAHVRPSEISQERYTLTSNSVNDRIGPA